MTAGIEKLLEITKIASPASRLKAAAAKELMYNTEQGNYSNLVYLEGHSRGTMTLSNALRVLAGFNVGDTKLEVLAYNPAAEGNRLAEAAALVTKKPVKTWAPPKDFVANKIGGYAGNATFHDLREIFQTNYSVHSSGGTAALGSDSTHVNAPELFSYEGLDIKDMNAKRQGRTIGLLQQWQKTPSPENPVATQLTQLQRLLWQSGQWQQQLDNTPGLLTRPTPTTPDAPSARQAATPTVAPVPHPLLRRPPYVPASATVLLPAGRQPAAGRLQQQHPHRQPHRQTDDGRPLGEPRPQPGIFPVGFLGQYTVKHAFINGINIDRCYPGAPPDHVQVVMMTTPTGFTTPGIVKEIANRPPEPYSQSAALSAPSTPIPATNTSPMGPYYATPMAPRKNRW